MTFIALALGLTLATSDALTRIQLDGLSLKAPTSWQRDGDRQNPTWKAPSDDASFALTVVAVDPPRDAHLCVSEIATALKLGEVESIQIAGQPAARKVTRDFVGDRQDENRVVTTMVVGCNGKTRWAMTWVHKSTSAKRFEALQKRIAQSMRYAR